MIRKTVTNKGIVMTRREKAKRNARSLLMSPFAIVSIVVLAVSCVAVPLGALAQIDERITTSRDQLEDALNEWSMDSLMSARAEFERLLGRGGRDWLVRYYIALADYRLAIWHIAVQDPEDMRPFLDEAEDLLKESIEERPEFAETHALLCSTLGLKISLKPISGMWLGPRIGGIMAEATQLDPENPRTWMIEGIGAYHRPKMFGGGYKNAREAMLKSIAYFETYAPADPVYPIWGESEAHAWLAKMEMENGELASAETRLEKALDLNPSNGWVIHVLSSQLSELRQAASAN